MNSTTNTQSNIHNGWGSITLKEIQAILGSEVPSAVGYDPGKTVSHFNDYYYYTGLSFESAYTTPSLDSILSKNEDEPYNPENEPKLIP